MEIIQELKTADWEEEKTFYGPCVNFDTALTYYEHGLRYICYSLKVFFLTCPTILEARISREE